MAKLDLLSLLGFILLAVGGFQGYIILRKIKSDEYIDQSNSTWDLTNLNNKNRS